MCGECRPQNNIHAVRNRRYAAPTELRGHFGTGTINMPLLTELFASTPLLGLKLGVASRNCCSIIGRGCSGFGKTCSTKGNSQSAHVDSCSTDGVSYLTNGISC